MDPNLIKYYNKLKDAGLSLKREKKILLELYDDKKHDIDFDFKEKQASPFDPFLVSLYSYNDMTCLQNLNLQKKTYVNKIQSIDDLIEKDNQREKDGFPKKIRVGRMIKPGKGGKDKIIIVPTTVEEKFIHDNNFSEEDNDDKTQSSGGAGDGEEGEIIGEQPVHQPGKGDGEGPGEGEGAEHEVESSAYDLGKILTDQFQLPNLKDKGKRRSLTKYTYDMTDKNRGFGQFLDKKATLRRIVETNIALGKLADVNDIDTTKFLISPGDRVFRILSKEIDYESQAIVFFLRDYSGSMGGKPTQLVVSQHVMIYSWLLYQYSMQVETRFILHDTEAKEVPDFYTYYNSRVAGGTKIASAYKLVNKIVDDENLIVDYNIYIFHGTDGDDWDTDGKETLPELRQMLLYASRIGITIAEHSYQSSNKTELEKYLRRSGLLESKKDFLKLGIIPESADEPALIEGIKKLIS